MVSRDEPFLSSFLSLSIMRLDKKAEKKPSPPSIPGTTAPQAGLHQPDTRGKCHVSASTIHSSIETGPLLLASLASAAHGHWTSQGPQSTAHAASPPSSSTSSAAEGRARGSRRMCNAGRGEPRERGRRLRRSRRLPFLRLPPTPHGQALADALARYDGICMPD